MRKLVLLAGALFLFPAVADAQTHIIGVAGPITGANAAFGQQLKNGVVYGIEAINAAGGVLGQKYHVRIYDDACDPKEATRVAQRAALDNVKIIIGHFCSSSSIPASTVYAEANVLMISPASSNPALTERNLWNTFRVTGRDDRQGTVAAQFILNGFASRNIAILHDKTTYGKGLADETRKVLNAGGVRDRVYEGFNSGDKDFSAIVSRLKAQNIGFVYVGGFHTEIGLLLRQMRGAGVRAILMSGDGIVSSEFPTIAGSGTVDGTLFTFAPDARKNPAARDAVAALSRVSASAEGYTLYAYAAVQAWAQAAAAARSVDPRQVAAALKSGTFNTAIGQLSFDAKGDRRQPDHIVYRWDAKGSYQEFDSVVAVAPGAAAPPPPPAVVAPPPPPPVVQAPPPVVQTPPPAPPPAVANVPPPKQAAPAPAISERRVALVIGNSAYRNVSALTNPQRDASAIAGALRQSGFQSVTVLTDLDRNKLTDALQKFAEIAETADWSVVYFAGHGMEIGGVNYLIPVDAKLASDRDIEFQAVSLNTVLNAAERAKKLRLVILDACRDNPFAAQMKRTMASATRSVTRGLAQVEPEAGTMVVYAAKHGETALDGSGSNSPFATSLAKNLLTPGLEVRRLFDTVRDDVMDITGRKQQPFSYGSISARQDFYFTAAR